MSRTTPQSTAEDILPTLSIETVPTFLPRPADFTLVDDVARPTLAMMIPELAKLAGHVIRHQLFLRSDQLLAGLDGVQLPYSMASNSVPPILHVARPDRPDNRPVLTPTHVLALGAPLNVLTPPDAPVSLIAIHGPVFAAHCARLAMPPTVRPLRPDFISLPVMRLNVPSRTAFVILRAFMYSRRADTFLDALIPFPTKFLAEIRRGNASDRIKAARASQPEIISLTQHLILGTQGGPEQFWERVHHLHAVWETMTQLAMSDSLLWEAFELAWLLARAALAAATGHMKKIIEASEKRRDQTLAQK
ncbi:hypothetical protein FB451DRAFT_1526562 [Mycena latifolia]|nr:hypothetical protein FB451DRAFT_1526562 [Mycena latifolia]